MAKKTILTVGKNASVRGGSGKEDIRVTGSNATVYAGAGNDTIQLLSGDNVKLYGEAGNDYIDMFGGKYAYIDGGAGKDTIRAFYSERDTDIKDALDVGGFPSILGGADDDVILFYPAKIGRQTRDSRYNPFIDGGTGNDTIEAFGDASSIFGGEGNDLISVGYSVSVYGGAGNDTIRSGGYDSIQGGKGNDLLELSYSDTILYANGDGKDTVFSSYGDWENPTIRLLSGSISKETITNDDVMLTIGSGSITLKNATGTKFTIVDAKGNKTIKSFGGLPTGASYNSKKTTVTLSAKFTKSTFDAEIYASTIKTIDASKIENFANIYGNDNDNVIKAGKYGGYLCGREGDDTLYGGASYDIFGYEKGDGNDVIVNYTSGKDTVHVTRGTIKSYTVKNSDVILNIANGSITIKNGKGKAISIRDANYDTKTYNFKKGTNKKLSTALVSGSSASILTAETAAAEKLANTAAALAPASLGTFTDTKASSLLTESTITPENQPVLISGAGN